MTQKPLESFAVDVLWCGVAAFLPEAMIVGNDAVTLCFRNSHSSAVLTPDSVLKLKFFIVLLNALFAMDAAFLRWFTSSGVFIARTCSNNSVVSLSFVFGNIFLIFLISANDVVANSMPNSFGFGRCALRCSLNGFLRSSMSNVVLAIPA